MRRSAHTATGGGISGAVILCCPVISAARRGCRGPTLQMERLKPVSSAQGQAAAPTTCQQTRQQPECSQRITCRARVGFHGGKFCLESGEDLAALKGGTWVLLSSPPFPHTYLSWVGGVWVCTWGLLNYPQGFRERCKLPSFLPGDSQSLNLG